MKSRRDATSVRSNSSSPREERVVDRAVQRERVDLQGGDDGAVAPGRHEVIAILDGFAASAPVVVTVEPDIGAKVDRISIY